jgi:hypothetical protein
MARPERNNVDYFPFICEDGKKMYYIEETYGNDGFATFVKILRELAKTDYHYLDLSKPTTLMFLSAKCKVPKETLIAIINDLVDLDKFNSMLWKENRIIWCQDFVDNIQDAYKKRNNECITLDGLLLLLQGLGIRKQIKLPLNNTVNTHSIVKDIIEDNTIEKEKINTASPFKFFDSLISLGGDKQLVSDWISVRKLKKLTNTLTAFENFKIEVSKSGKNINEVLKECVINSWGGFKADWINKNNVTLPTKKRVIS